MINWMARITPEHIFNLKPDEIFVFGSNESGRHFAGSALAAQQWGAIIGQAVGLQGKTYAIPTKDASIKRTLSIDEIRVYVDEFIEFAKVHSELTFLVVALGTMLANHTPAEIAPLFKESIDLENVHLPASFWAVLRG